ncbi:MAG: DUF4168 domain-containing protein [Candidatus Delongbacteria bacterium]|nr:DUF4168 domain-containing protein [Candidatus Delongbacteria bacterium]
MRKLMKTTSLLLAFVFAASFGFTQQNEDNATEPITDAELSEFVKLQQNIQKINQEGQQVMVKAIKDNNLTVQQYQEIAKAAKQGKTIEMTQEESRGYKAADAVVTEQQKKMQQSMNEDFENSDMTKKRYIEINGSVSKDASLQQRLRDLQQKTD